MRFSFGRRIAMGVAGLLLAVHAGSARAAVVYDVDVNGPVSFTAQFTLSEDTVRVTLTNGVADPGSAADTLRSIGFNLSGVSSTGSITDFTGVNRTVNGTDVGNYTDAATTTTDWSLSGSGSYLLTATGPDYLVIGDPDASNAYGNANASITNDPHNPHLANSPTFTLTIAGVTDATVLSNIVFGYGTGSDTVAGGTPVAQPPHVTPVPEPASAAMAGALLVGIIAMRCRTRR